MYVRVHACFFVSNGTQQLGLLDLKVNTFAVQVYHLRQQLGCDGGCDCGCDLETTPGHLLWEIQQVHSDSGSFAEAHGEVAVLLSAPPPHSGVLLCLVRIGMCMYVCVHACFFFPRRLDQELHRRDLETTPGHLNPPGARITYGLQLQRLKVSHVTIYVHFKRPSVAEGQKQSSRT